MTRGKKKKTGSTKRVDLTSKLGFLSFTLDRKTLSKPRCEGGGACGVVLGYRDHVSAMHQEGHIWRITRAALTINFLAQRGNFLQVALL